jgi:hypothetical protein
MMQKSCPRSGKTCQLTARWIIEPSAGTAQGSKKHKLFAVGHQIATSQVCPKFGSKLVANFRKGNYFDQSESLGSDLNYCFYCENWCRL